MSYSAYSPFLTNRSLYEERMAYELRRRKQEYHEQETRRKQEAFETLLQRAQSGDLSYLSLKHSKASMAHVLVEQYKNSHNLNLALVCITPRKNDYIYTFKVEPITTIEF